MSTENGVIEVVLGRVSRIETVCNCWLFCGLREESCEKTINVFSSILGCSLVHEGAHALVAAAYGELAAFQVHTYGFEVIFKTPIAQRQGIEWGFISGASNVITVLLGYLLLFLLNP